MQGSSNTGFISKFNESEQILFLLSWISFSLSDSDIEHDAALVLNFKESLQPKKTNSGNGINPHCSVGFLFLEELNLFQDVNCYFSLALFMGCEQIVDTNVIQRVVSHENLFKFVGF